MSEADCTVFFICNPQQTQILNFTYANIFISFFKKNEIICSETCQSGFIEWRVHLFICKRRFIYFRRFTQLYATGNEYILHRQFQCTETADEDILLGRCSIYSFPEGDFI